MSEAVGWVVLLQAVVVLVVAATYLAAPGAGSSGGIFGRPAVPGWAESVEAEGVRRRYRRRVAGWSALALALAAIAALGSGTAGVVLAIAAPAVQLVGCALAWSRAWKAALPHLAPAAPTSVRRASLAPVSGALRPLLDLGGLVPLGLAALWLKAHFAEIPARYVIHWGPSGPDGWGGNTPRQVFAPLLPGAALVLSLAALHWFIRSSTPTGATPRQRASREMASAIFTAAGWFVGTLFAAFSFTALGAGLGTVLGIAMAGELALGGVAIWQLMRHSRLPPEPAPVSSPAAWRGGGLFYVAPDDPAIWVPKRVGVGWTVNLGHPQGRRTLALLVVVPLAVALGSIWLMR